MDYRQQQQQQGVGGGANVQQQPFAAEDPRYSATQTAYGSESGPGLGASAAEAGLQGPDQPPAAAAAAAAGAGSGAPSRLAAVFGNTGAKPLQPFPTPSRPPGAVAARDFTKRSTEQQQQQLGDQMGAGTDGGFNQLGTPPAYDQISNRDGNFQQTPAAAAGPPVVEKQPELGADPVAAAAAADHHQAVMEMSAPSDLNQLESNRPAVAQENLHIVNPELHETRNFGGDSEGESGQFPGAAAAPSEPGTESSAEGPDPAQIGTAAAALGMMDDEMRTQQQSSQFGTGSAAEESLGAPGIANLQQPVEDKSSLDSESNLALTDGELLRDPVEQQSSQQLGTTDGVSAVTGSEFEEIPASDPVLGQTQFGADRAMDEHNLQPVKGITGLGEQETGAAYADADPGNIGTGVRDMKLDDEPSLQQSQLGAEESLVKGATGDGPYQQQPVEGSSWDSEMKPSSELHDPVLQQTQFGTESNARGLGSLDAGSEMPHEELDDTVPQQQGSQMGTGGAPRQSWSEDSREVPSANPQQQTADGLQTSNAYDMNDQSPSPGIPNTHVPTAADTTESTVGDGMITKSEGTSMAQPADPMSETHVENEQMNSQDTDIGKNAQVAASLKGDELPANNLSNANELPENEPATPDDDDDMSAPAAAAAPAKKGMFASLMNKILPVGSRNA